MADPSLTSRIQSTSRRNRKIPPARLQWVKYLTHPERRLATLALGSLR